MAIDVKGCSYSSGAHAGVGVGGGLLVLCMELEYNIFELPPPAHPSLYKNQVFTHILRD